MNVGKTAIIRRYVQKTFNLEHVMTLGLDFMSAKFNTPEGNDIEVRLWDTAGQERFRGLTQSFYKRADGICVCFDVTEQGTFDGISDWQEQVQEYGSENVPVMLVGNKIECEAQERVISKEQGQKEGKKLNWEYAEVSAKTDENLEELFSKLFQKAWIYRFSEPTAPTTNMPRERNNSISLKNPKIKKKKSCCGGKK